MAHVDRPAGTTRDPWPHKVGAMERRSYALNGYLTTVSVVGLPVFALAVVTVHPGDVRRHLLAVLVAAVLLVAGELRPIPVARGADAGDELSISSTIAVALLLLMAPGVGCLTQAVALFVDALRGRTAWTRPRFNMSHHALSLLAAPVIFSALPAHPIFGQP